MASLIGKEIGKYRITERIGRGGMAEVYAGVHTHLDRKVAVKVLHSYLLEGGDFVARFKREAKAVANLLHPNIVQVYDFDIQDDLIFMVMQYIDGLNLHAKLVETGKTGERLPIKFIASIINDIAAALDYAHSKGMLHRDIKPSNIMIDQDNKAYLTDFGIAKLFDDKKFTATGQIIGTPAYMSPEQARGENLTEESDIYSLGVVSFEMLTGQVPYDAETPIGIALKQINDPVPTMSELVDDIPGTAQGVIDKALSKVPDSRYSSAEELVGALKIAMQALEALESVPVSIPEDPPTVVDDGLEAPTVTMKTADLEDPTVVMEDAIPEKKAKKEPPAEKPKVKTDKKKIPLWAMITGGIVVLGVAAVILTQIFDLGLPGSDPALPAAQLTEADPTSTPVIITEAVEVRFDAYHTSDGLSIQGRGDSDYEFVIVEGTPKQCWRSGNGQVLPSDDGNTIEDSYLEFDIIDDFIYQVPPGAEVRFLIGYLDEGTDSFLIEYDAHSGGPYNNGKFMPSETVTKTDSGYFKTVEFIFKDAYLANRDDGADFRIVDMGDGAETINSLIITLLPTEAGSPGEMSAEEFFQQGVAYFEQERYPEAVEAFDLALEQGFFNADVYNYRGRSNYARGFFEESIEDFTRAIEQDEGIFWYWFNRGRSRFELGDLQGALEDIRTAVELGADKWTVFQTLGEYYFFSEDEQYKDEAFQAFDRAIEINPDQGISYLMRAKLHWCVNEDAEAALEDLNLAVQFAEPGSSDPLTWRGYVYLETEQYELCLPDFNQAIEINPEDALAYILRGEYYAGLGEVDPARVDYERFLELAGDNSEFQDQVERVKQWLDEN